MDARLHQPGNDCGTDVFNTFRMQLHRTQCARERNRGFFRPASAISVSRQQSVQGWQQKIPTTERWFQQAQLVQRAIGCIPARSEEHTSELQSLMRISYAVFCL